MTYVQAAEKRICQLCRELGFNRNRLSEASGVSSSTIKDINAGHTGSCRSDTMLRIANGLGCSAMDFHDTSDFDLIEETVVFGV